MEEEVLSSFHGRSFGQSGRFVWSETVLSCLRIISLGRHVSDI